MTKTRKRWLPLVALCMIGVALASSIPMVRQALAQSSGPTGLQSVNLSIQPEYDDPLAIGSPTVLVSLDGQIEGATAPTTIKFLVPSGAYMYSAGSGPRSQYQGGPPNRNPSSTPGWDEISFTLKTQYFVVEYYLPIGTAPNRSFTASLIPEYPISGLNVEVLQPTQSTNFSATPNIVPINQQQATNQGFNATEYQYNTLDAQQTLSFALSYTRNTLTPSLGSNGSPAAGGGLNTTALVILIVVGLAVLGLVGYWVVGKPAPRRRTPTRTAARAAARGKGTKGAAPEGGKFCADCGARMRKGARYCPECGAKQKQQ